MTNKKQTSKKTTKKSPAKKKTNAKKVESLAAEKVIKAEAAIKEQINKDKIQIEKLLAQVKLLESDIISKDKIIERHEINLAEINRDYVKKIQEKAEQAQQLIKQNHSELAAKFNNELKESKKYAIEKAASQLLDIIAKFDMALSYSPSDEKIKNYQNGFKMFLSMFKELLVDLEIKEIPISINDEFDSVTMEAVDHVAAENVQQNHVAIIVEKGYKLYDRVIKVALVKLAE
ncbi:MAG: nucleotide exchange factor GrpE [Mycoplasmataceae bacterium]|jgi:molecular chaperone GrpE|nr:nucleotide exchange factor GrpE [Mycoplasmataceae bacterium]